MHILTPYHIPARCINSLAGIVFFVAVMLSSTTYAQTYADTIQAFRKEYINEHLNDKRSPIKKDDVRYLDFFPADKNYRVEAVFALTPGSKPFTIPTHSGKNKPFREYGFISFSIHDTALTLHIYQSVDVVNGSASNTYLFLPFNDLSNYETTYGGGRYIDLKTTDIVNGKLLLDFNKCYNPYCAYAEGFSCPIPPDENRLPVLIPVGEKEYLRYKER